MADRRNFILGFGERLTAPVTPGPKGGPKKHPYTPAEALARLSPALDEMAAEFEELPSNACPNDETVALFSLHPSYLSKSYFPEALFDSVGMRAVGSRAARIKPSRPVTQEQDKECPTSEIFVAGSRTAFRKLTKTLRGFGVDSPAVNEVRKIEAVRPHRAADRVKSFWSKSPSPMMEVVLHASEGVDDGYIIREFVRWVKRFGVAETDRRRTYAGGLCFLAFEAPRTAASAIADFSFVRVLREMPRLRAFQAKPVAVPIGLKPGTTVQLPSGGPIDPNLTVAVFDGGYPASPDLSTWAKEMSPPGVVVGPRDPLGEKHGLAVTSSLLFGPLPPNGQAPRPPATVHHFRVVDQNTNLDRDLPEVLDRITATLDQFPYKFVNLSIGPEHPLDDDDVHRWTAVLDEYFGKRELLATVAAGNGGQGDAASGMNRVQTPADCVNALTVGASDHNGPAWARANYSSVGPGRSPGLVKPDCVAFGGCDTRGHFHVLAPNAVNVIRGVYGTSYAAPLALRSALALRAHFGDILGPLALKALLLSSAERAQHPLAEVGWGRIETSLEVLATCAEDEVRVVYQGTLSPSKWLRASLPLPSSGLVGSVEVRIAICFSSATDPQDPVNYTRSGLELVFRPKGPGGKTHALFGKGSLYPTEAELRSDAHKWETTLCASHNFRASSLGNAVLDVHYVARELGGLAKSPQKIPYAMVVTIRAPKVLDLYDRVVQRFQTQLEPMVPKIGIPVTIAGPK